MTLDEIKAAKASPELDEEVSKRVMGFTRRTPRFEPSRSIKDAFEVVRAMRRNGYYIEIIQREGGWRVFFWAGRPEPHCIRRLHAAFSDESLPLAVCVAALTVMLMPRGGDEDSFPPNRPDMDAARRTMRVKAVGDGD